MTPAFGDKMLSPSLGMTADFNTDQLPPQLVLEQTGDKNGLPFAVVLTYKLAFTTRKHLLLWLINKIHLFS